MVVLPKSVRRIRSCAAKLNSCGLGVDSAELGKKWLDSLWVSIFFEVLISKSSRGFEAAWTVLASDEFKARCHFQLSMILIV